MAAWFRIYCTRPLDHVTPDGVQTAIGAAERHMLEALRLEDDDAVPAAPTRLRIERDDGTGGVWCRIHDPGSWPRPLEVHVWMAEAEIDEMREEELERLEETGGGTGRIRSHLGRTVAVAAVQLGWSQMEDMGAVLARAIAEHLAVLADGLIRDPRDEWWAIEKGFSTRISEPEGSARDSIPDRLTECE
jgi:hypothetical protein